MLTIPAGILFDAAERKVGIGNFLTGALMAVAVFINHHCPALLHLQFDVYKPIGRAYFIQVADSSVHESISNRRIGQVFGAIGEQVFAGDAVLASGAGELAQILSVKNGGWVHALRSCVWLHTACFLSSGLGNEYGAETRWIGGFQVDLLFNKPKPLCLRTEWQIAHDLL
jgi:hypothetical protein